MIVALVLFTALKGRLLHVKIFFNIKWVYLYLAILYAFVLASYTVAGYLSSRVLLLKFFFQIDSVVSLSFCR